MYGLVCSHIHVNIIPARMRDASIYLSIPGTLRIGQRRALFFLFSFSLDVFSLLNEQFLASWHATIVLVGSWLPINIQGMSLF